MKTRSWFLRIMLLVAFMIGVHSFGLAQIDSTGNGGGGGSTVFDLAAWFAALMASGGVIATISGWLGKLLKVEGIWMQLLTWVIAGLVALAASLMGLIPVHISDVWKFLVVSFGGGLMTNVLYALGVYDHILKLFGAVTPHQAAQ